MDEQKVKVATNNNREPWIKGNPFRSSTKLLHWALYKQPAPSWDHDHCLFCFRRFAEPSAGYNDSVEYGWTTGDEYDWVCMKCFQDFKDHFGWVIELTDDVSRSYRPIS